jgi:WD40 repeat protein
VGWQVGTLAGNTGEVSSVEFSSDGKHIVSQNSRALTIWDAATGAQVSSFYPGKCIRGYGSRIQMVRSDQDM